MTRLLLVFLSIMLLASCSNVNGVGDKERSTVVGEETPQFESYNGRPLKIAVVGQSPDIKEEEKIKFIRMDFAGLQQIDSPEFDAVFIMKDFLHEAAESDHAELYKTTNLPFFFIQSEKITYAFSNADSSYESAPSLSNSEYAVGYYNQKEGHLSWKYNSYNDMTTPETIMQVYSMIFTTIEELPLNNSNKKDSSSTSLTYFYSSKR
ncbi:hypothetical protein [Alkalihalobacillus sp. R86527]|uniref:hypothetical protein n=1 Tax=Alkalihalobacillus sp. R86527 TaxID=3093863 RepID=UPI00366A9E22